MDLQTLLSTNLFPLRLRLSLSLRLSDKAARRAVKHAFDTMQRRAPPPRLARLTDSSKGRQADSKHTTAVAISSGALDSRLSLKDGAHCVKCASITRSSSKHG